MSHRKPRNWKGEAIENLKNSRKLPRQQFLRPPPRQLSIKSIRVGRLLQVWFGCFFGPISQKILAIAVSSH